MVGGNKKSKKTLSIIISLMLFFVIFCENTSQVNAGTRIEGLNIGTTQNVYLSSCNNGFFLYEAQKNAVLYNSVSKNGSYIYGTLSPTTTYSASALRNNSVYITLYEYEKETDGTYSTKTAIKRIMPNGEIQAVCEIGRTSLKSRLGLTLNKNNDFIMMYGNYQVNVYSYGGAFKYSMAMDSYVYQTITNPTGDLLYIIRDDGMYVVNALSQAQPNRCGGDTPNYPVSFINDEYIIDQYGGIFKVDGQHITKVYSSGRSSITPNAGIIGNTCYLSKGKTVFAVNLKTGKETAKYSFEHSIDSVSVSASKVAAYSKDSRCLYLLESSEFISTETTPPSSGNSSSGGQSSSSGSNSSKNNSSSSNSQSSSSSVQKTLSFGSYKTEKYCGALVIPAGTTVAGVKKEITYTGYNIAFYKADGTAKTSGNVGTGMVMLFSDAKTGETKTYKLLIKGDNTGEGNVNTRDKQKIVNHLLEKEHLSGLYYHAADMNTDGIVDTRDLVAVAQAYS